MASNVDDLKEALKASLQNGGQLQALKAKLRADIFNTLAESEVGIEQRVLDQSIAPS